MNPTNFFLNLIFLSHVSSSGRDFQMSHASAHGVIHFHVDICCHVNSIGPSTPFGTSHIILNGVTLVRAVPPLLA
jgi:hypothetical protein